MHFELLCSYSGCFVLGWKCLEHLWQQKLAFCYLSSMRKTAGFAHHLKHFHPKVCGTQPAFSSSQAFHRVSYCDQVFVLAHCAGHQNTARLVGIVALSKKPTFHRVCNCTIVSPLPPFKALFFSSPLGSQQACTVATAPWPCCFWGPLSVLVLSVQQFICSFCFGANTLCRT